MLRVLKYVLWMRNKLDLCIQAMVFVMFQISSFAA